MRHIKNVHGAKILNLEGLNTEKRALGINLMCYYVGLSSFSLQVINFPIEAWLDEEEGKREE